MSANPLRSSAKFECRRLFGIAWRSPIIASMVRPRSGGTGSARRPRRSSEARKSLTRPSTSCPISQSGSRITPRKTLASLAAPCSTRSWRSVRASPSHMPRRPLAGDRVADGPRLEPAADRLDHQLLRSLVVIVGRGDQVEDPAGEELLDGAVEDHRREVRVDVVAELAGALS